ncbi:MAG: PIG-L family deacetylase [Chloroflexi bacterium]|nr:PIG-L family deacetylase [Chloroflexota bacterium]
MVQPTPSHVDQSSAPGRTLAILAHPDDPDFLAGGTVAGWTDAGGEVVYLLCTRGDGGTTDPTISHDQLAEQRQAEQRAAGLALGVHEVHFLEHGDGQLQHTLDLRRQLVRAIRRIRPDRLLCFDPATRWYADYVNHPDHYLSGEAALAAVFPTARERLAFPELLEQEGLEPHAVMEIWLVGTLQPNYWQDIGATLERKIAAMRCHVSQVGDGQRVEGVLRQRAADAGAQASPPLAAAEPFRVIRLRN